ncbi:hypothetical protein Leryth_010041 [Lithospermum erythrorhizon]|nr:hypothetical protein Leryth_010041 [Lithospermum erythrorhizon]
MTSNKKKNLEDLGRPSKFSQLLGLQEHNGMEGNVIGRWCRDYKRSTGSISEEVDLEAKRCSNFGERCKYISDLINGATSRLGYDEDSYNILLYWVLHGIKEAENRLLSKSHTTEPSRVACSTLSAVETNEVEYLDKTIKQRQQPIKSKIRLMFES